MSCIGEKAEWPHFHLGIRFLIHDPFKLLLDMVAEVLAAGTHLRWLALN